MQYLLILIGAAIYVIGMFCDLNSNKDGQEANARLRGADGKIDLKKAIIGKAVVGLILGGAGCLSFMGNWGCVGLIVGGAGQMCIGYLNMKTNKRNREILARREAAQEAAVERELDSIETDNGRM